MRRFLKTPRRGVRRTSEKNGCQMQLIRLFFQIFFIEAVLYHSILFSMGASYKNCESFCPFGAVETLVLFIKNGRFPCAINELNYAIFFGVILLCLFFKRIFCSWVCPLGAVNEFLTFVRSKIIKYENPYERIMSALGSIKYILLVFIAYVTYVNYDLVFRPYCPYFTAFGIHGHTTNVLSYFVLANILLLTLTIKLGFCRVLCPFGAFLSIFNSKTVFKIYRDEKACVNCAQCDKACYNGIAVSRETRIESRECSLCLRCVSACASRSALKIGM